MCPPLTITEKTVTAVLLCMVLALGILHSYVHEEVCEITGTKTVMGVGNQKRSALSPTPTLGSTLIVSLSTTEMPVLNTSFVAFIAYRSSDMQRAIKRWPVGAAVQCGIAPLRRNRVFSKGIINGEYVHLIREDDDEPEDDIEVVVSATIIAVWITVMLALRIWACRLYARVEAAKDE
jgi:hypothetical protein